MCEFRIPDALRSSDEFGFQKDFEIHKSDSSIKVQLEKLFDDTFEFHDDENIEIIKKTEAYDLLKEFHAHSSNLRKSLYFLDKNITKQILTESLEIRKSCL